MVDWVAPQKNARAQLVLVVVLNRNRMEKRPFKVVDTPDNAKAEILGLSDVAPNIILGKEFPAPSMELIS